MVSGYRCPKGHAGLNEYLSEFGDPFSLFFYRFSGGYKYYYKGYTKRASLISENESFSVFRFDKGVEKQIVELVCFGTLLDLKYFRNVLDADKDKSIITHLFYRMVLHGESKIIMSKNDPLDHYSIDSMSKYLPKLKWRIINNVHYPDRASQGFQGRTSESGGAKWKKFLFPFYSASILLPVFDAIYLSASRRNAAFLWHPFLCLYVTTYIIYQYARKLIGFTPQLRTYDGKKEV